MATTENLIKAAADELEDAIGWFSREVRLWRALGDDDRHEDGSETLCFRPSRGIDVDAFEQKLRLTLHILTRMKSSKPEGSDNDNATKPNA